MAWNPSGIGFIDISFCRLILGAERHRPNEKQISHGRRRWQARSRSFDQGPFASSIIVGLTRTRSVSKLAAFFPVSFHSHIEVCDFLRELLLNRSFLDLAGARIQRFL